MTNEEIIEITDTLNANDKTMKEHGISDNLWGKAVECITFLQFENAELKSSLTHATEECLKWHERAQNLLKDSGGSISGYEKKISDLQAENAALRERLEKTVELPCKVGDKLFYVNEYYKIPKIEEHTVTAFTLLSECTQIHVESGGYFLTDTKNVFFDRAEAEACLAELKGEKK